jgi:hypothetical protein
VVMRLCLKIRRLYRSSDAKLRDLPAYLALVSDTAPRYITVRFQPPCCYHTTKYGEACPLSTSIRLGRKGCD